jgi:cytochrome oxidase assembly protein ShyY1
VFARLRTARALGLLVIAVVVMAAMIAMGRWQFGVYDDHQRADALAVMRQAPVPIDTVLGPDDAFASGSIGTPVVVSGRYDRSDQLYVRGVPGAGERYGVVTPLVTASGSAVLVLRGSSPVPRAPAASGRVRVSGILEPSQSGSGALDASRVTTGVRIGALVSDVHPDLYSGYVVLTNSEPVEQLGKIDPPLPDPSRWAGVRNLLYAVQWWIFAAFVAFMWWRIINEDRSELVAPTSEKVGPESVG